MEREMQVIEEALNKLCSQHDQLMSLLTISDFIANLKTLQIVNNSITNKLTLLEREINQLTPTQIQIHTHDITFVKEIEEHANASLEEEKKTIAKIKSAIISTQDDTNEVAQTAQTDEIVDKLKKKAKQLCDQFDQECIKIVAQQKVELRAHQNKDQANQAHILLSKVHPDLDFILQRIEHQIEQKRLEFDVPPFAEFVAFTITDIKRNTEMLKSLIQDDHKKAVHPEQAQSRRLYYCRMKKQLEYRLQGLKRYCRQQLMMQYYQKSQQPVQQKEQLRINSQMKLKESLQQLQRNINGIKLWEQPLNQ